MIEILLNLLLFILIGVIIWWIVKTVMGLLKVPEPISTVVLVILLLIALIIIIGIFTGYPGLRVYRIA